MVSDNGRGAKSEGKSLEQRIADLPDHQSDPELREAFLDSVDDGVTRLRRSLSTLLATGLVGGVDLGIGVIALLAVKHATGSEVLGALAFTVGFIALVLGRSELFTENFLVPVAAVVAQKARIRELARLWSGTFVMNLVGGWVFMGLIIGAKDELGETALELSSVYMELGIGPESFALGMVGGAVITVMTWMQRHCDTNLGAQIIAAVSMSFVLALVPLNHVIVSSLEMFAALHHGADFGYLDYAGVAIWAALANLVGGLFLVTVVRLVQVGPQPVVEERQRNEETSREDESVGGGN